MKQQRLAIAEPRVERVECDGAVVGSERRPVHRAFESVSGSDLGHLDVELPEPLVVTVFERIPDGRLHLVLDRFGEEVAGGLLPGRSLAR